VQPRLAPRISRGSVGAGVCRLPSCRDPGRISGDLLGPPNTTPDRGGGHQPLMAGTAGSWVLRVWWGRAMAPGGGQAPWVVNPARDLWCSLDPSGCAVLDAPVARHLGIVPPSPVPGARDAGQRHLLIRRVVLKATCCPARPRTSGQVQRPTTLGDLAYHREPQPRQPHPRESCPAPFASGAGGTQRRRPVICVELSCGIVRIEMPEDVGRVVRCQAVSLSVSRIKARSTSATVLPTQRRVTVSAASVACATGRLAPGLV